MNSTNVMKQYVCLLNRGGTVEAVLDDDGKIKVFKIFVEKEIRALTAGMVGSVPAGTAQLDRSHP